MAGYCWPWRSKTDASAIDIEIGATYRRRWNLDTDGSLWIIAPESIAQVGCIHTCQELEVDYVGVIVGPDLVVEDGEVRAVPAARAGQDQSIKGYKAMMQSDPERATALGELVVQEHVSHPDDPRDERLLRVLRRPHRASAPAPLQSHGAP